MIFYDKEKCFILCECKKEDGHCTFLHHEYNCQSRIKFKTQVVWLQPNELKEKTQDYE